jgi:uncharacterized protein (TIGR02246 family)
MKTILCFVVTIIFTLFVHTLAISSQPAARQELLKLENDWNAAYNRQDKEAVCRILRDDYLFIDADAYVLKKADYLGIISRVKVKSEDLKYTDVRVYGDTAIVHSLWSGTYSFDGKDITESIRYTDVFVRENGKWLAVASQGTRVPKQ